jgi:hypothetical protein
MPKMEVILDTCRYLLFPLIAFSRPIDDIEMLQEGWEWWICCIVDDTGLSERSLLGARSKH